MTTGLPSRHSAYQLLNQVIDAGLSLDNVLADAHHWQQLPKQDKAFAYNLTMEVLRHYGECRRIIADYVHKPLGGSVQGANIILAMGLVQLIQLKLPAHAVVDTSVSLAKEVGCEAVSGLINAVLKKTTKAEHRFDNPTANLPSWMRKSWQKAYGEDTVDAIMATSMQQPPLDLTVKSAPQLWAQKLGGTHLLGNTVRLAAGTDVTTLDGYEAGEWWVQDIAASLPAQLLGDIQDKNVVDLCAAPGGKTAQLVCAGAKVTAVDRSAERMQRLLANMQRLNMSVRTHVADLRDWQPIQAFDAILLDAPCSATGTLRRHPDILYGRKKEDIAKLAALQKELLSRACDLLTPKGIVIYAICSLQPFEAMPVIEEVLNTRSDITLSPISPSELKGLEECITKDGTIHSLPHYLAKEGGMDGFFVARLIKE